MEPEASFVEQDWYSLRAFGAVCIGRWFCLSCGSRRLNYSGGSVRERLACRDILIFFWWGDWRLGGDFSDCWLRNRWQGWSFFRRCRAVIGICRSWGVGWIAGSLVSRRCLRVRRLRILIFRTPFRSRRRTWRRRLHLRRSRRSLLLCRLCRRHTCRIRIVTILSRMRKVVLMPLILRLTCLLW